MAQGKIAETPQEFFEKYKSKKFRQENAGLCIILEYIYQTYLLRAGDTDQLPEHLYSPERYHALIAKGMASENARDKWLVNGMQSLVEWLPTANDSATTAREAAHMAIHSAINIVSSSVYMISKISGFYDHDPELLSNQGSKAGIIESMSEFEFDVREQYDKTREFINNNLRFVHAYNTFIEILTEELKIPETIIFQIYTGKTERLLTELNQISKGKYDTLLELDTDYTELVSYGEPIELVPSPIPEENLRNSTASIVRSIYYGGAWGNAFLDMTDKYWRRVLSNG